MGAQNSSLDITHCVCLDPSSSDDAIDPDVAALMPSFFASQPGAQHLQRLSEETVMSVQRSWNKIMMGTARNYLYLKSTPAFIYTDSLDWFGQTFFVNLFEHYPSIIPLFTVHMSELGRVLAIKMGEIVDLLTDPPKCSAILIELAREYSLLGVHAVHYGMFAEIFLITLKNTLKEDYSDYAHTSWVKVFTHMLLKVVPVALLEDRKQKLQTVADAAAAAAQASS